ncbi:MAG: phosphotransferase [Nocardiopsaceae bacterium]|jgi:maltokinase|nr:phosphotransferase [Nocardiopsaceae bacterium]
MTFEETLAAWLPAQRWFAGKGVGIGDLTVTADTAIADGDPALRHLIVSVSQGASAAAYQVLVGLRSDLPERLEHAVIGPAGGGLTAYDALHDHDLTRLLLAGIAAGGSAGPLRFARQSGAQIETDLDSLALTGEQSNTSLVFGEASILKVFRKLTPGPNPDLEVTRALARLGSRHIAGPLGWIEMPVTGTPTVLAILSAYLRTATDGWSMAATSVRDYFAGEAASAASAGGDFAGEAHRLGGATAEVHRTLAEAFGTEELPASAAADLAGQMRARLDEAVANVPELAPRAGLLAAAFSDLAKLDAPLTVQRVHGDYHLGQVMRTDHGWVIIDFEGEPARPLAERLGRHPVLKDVAGMLRSFEYAAWQQLLSADPAPRLRDAARDWAHRNQAAFCAGYAEAGGPDPAGHATLLRALTLDKAVYEVMYEARNRPSWLSIPLESLDDA